jgi:hypothetical protein
MEPAKKKAELDEKVKALEEEKACLLAEIEVLKAIPKQEEKIYALEADITKLKEEKKTLEETVTPPPCEETASAEAPTPAEAPAEMPAEAAPVEALAPAEEKPCEPCEEAKPSEEKPYE